MRIAIHRNENIFAHSTNWSYAWEEYCADNKIDYQIVNCYDNNIIGTLRDFDILLWHFSNHSYHEMLFARSVLQSAHAMGLVTFPDFESSWHFDDKISEDLLLQTAGAPMPGSWKFFRREEAVAWLKEKAQFPLIAKLRSGSGSMNVKLIHSPKEGIAYAKKLFGDGVDPSPNPYFKISSNVKATKSIKDLLSKFKRIPDFISTLRGSRLFPNERGYVYFQEFIPNAGFDLKIVTVGDKTSYICRNIRKNDFRASGGGSLFFDKTLVSKETLESARKTSSALNFSCMGYDFVVDTRDGNGKIVEISYGFSHKALMMAGGYWDKNLAWVDEPLNAPCELLANITRNS